MSGFIYGLTDPRTGEIRYVGRSVNDPWYRYLVHTRDTSSCYKARWIRSLMNQGLKPGFFIIEMNVPVTEINAYECWWIAQGRNWGWRLTNGTRGGDGLVDATEDVRKNMREAWKTRPPMSAATRAKLSVSLTGRKYTETGKANVSAGTKRSYTPELRQVRSEQMIRLWAERRKGAQA